MITNDVHNRRKQFMLANSPTDRILNEYFDRSYSEFVTSAGGDVTVYRVYGDKDFSMGIK